MTVVVKCSECKEEMDPIAPIKPGENYLFQCPNCKKVRGIDFTVFQHIESPPNTRPTAFPDLDKYGKKYGITIITDK